MPALSYWQHSAALPSEFLAAAGNSALPQTCEVAVVGGGLLGVATAYFLARAGADVVVIEREMVGSGATARNAGFVTSGTAEAYPAALETYGRATTRAVWKFTLDNRALLRQALEEEAIACDYREPGCLTLACSDAEYRLLEANVRLLAADGIATELLDVGQVGAMLGLKPTARVVGAGWAPGEGLLHSGRFIYGLARAAQRHGARFCLGRTVDKIAPGAGAWEVRTSIGRGPERMSAGTVVCAVNAWLPKLLPDLRHAITPVRGQVLATAPAPPIFPCGMSADGGLQYWQQAPDGRIVLGGCRPAAADREVGYTEPELRPEVQHALDGYLHTLFEDLPELEVEHRWAGIMAFSRDALPLIGALPGADGLLVAGGFTGHGMPFGLQAGKALAESCVSGSVSPVLDPFRLDRPSLKG